MRKREGLEGVCKKKREIVREREGEREKESLSNGQMEAQRHKDKK